MIKLSSKRNYLQLRDPHVVLTRQSPLRKNLIASAVSAALFTAYVPIVEAAAIVVNTATGTYQVLSAADSLTVTSSGSLVNGNCPINSGGTYVEVSLCTIHDDSSITPFGSISIAGSIGDVYLPFSSITGGFTVSPDGVTGDLRLSNTDIILNNGAITSIYLYDDAGTITNNGTIITTGLNSTGLTLGGDRTSINALTNTSAGQISGASYGFSNRPSGGSTIASFNNQGSITGGLAGIDLFSGWYYGDTTNPAGIDQLNNTGTISGSGANGNGIYLDGSEGAVHINTVENSATGSISGTGTGNGIQLGGALTQITTITNLGTIAGGITGYGISNQSGLIGTLNNAQGASNAAGALTFTGTLPTNYNIIINSTTNYGQLAVTDPAGLMNFGISSLSAELVTEGHTYQDVITGVAPGDIVGTGALTVGGYIVGASSGYDYHLVYHALNTWWLDILASGPSAEDTQASLRQSAYTLRSAYNMQTALVNAGLNYDCTTFDNNGVCLSAGGRFTSVDSPAMNTAGALLIAAYSPTEQVRVGAYLDQNLSTNNTPSIRLSNNKPMRGVFGVWNENPDRTGFEIRLAAGYSDKDLTVTRSVIGTSEAGTGHSSLTSTAASATLSYGKPLGNSRWMASPYAGIRYSKVKRDGYTESLTADVTTPLTYADLSQKTTTALVGMRLNGQVAEKTYLMGSIGLEQDLNHDVNHYAAIGVDDIAQFAFNPDVKRTRPVASVGAAYVISPTQLIYAQALYSQEAFQSSGSATGLIAYQVGF